MNIKPLEWDSDGDGGYWTFVLDDLVWYSLDRGSGDTGWVVTYNTESCHKHLGTYPTLREAAAAADSDWSSRLSKYISP